MEMGLVFTDSTISPALRKFRIWLEKKEKWWRILARFASTQVKTHPVTFQAGTKQHGEIPEVKYEGLSAASPGVPAVQGLSRDES